jgi:RNA-directed DNA polymerase
MIQAVYTNRERAAVAALLSDVMLTARWKTEAVAEAGAVALEHWPSWLDALAAHVVSIHPRPEVADRDALVAVVDAFLSDRRAGSERIQFDWPVAQVESVPALAETLELSDGQLAWLADVRSLERTVGAERLRNYRYAAVPRRSGLPRVIEAPKLRLKEVQRWILREILDHVPVHESAQGFTRGRSVIDHATLHIGRHTVLRLDLADFFASVTAGRVFGIFRTLGYHADVAHALTGLTTNTVPVHVWEVVRRAAAHAEIGPRFWLGRQLAAPHLPQGAPTSPALANLAAFRLDRRLAGLAAAAGLRYSRYADDLTFSGGRLRRGWTDLEAFVAGIARDEGFRLNTRKSILRTAAARQQVCGIVVNDRLNVTRAEYDRLKAILHNAARHGPGSQGPAADRAHLEGRVAWVASLNPARGDKLKRRLAQIDWTA